MTDYDRVILVKNEVYVYRIGPRTSNRGYRAAEWQLEKPDWTGRLRVVARGEKLFIKLEDRNSGDLFAMCPVDAHPGAAVEPVLDSSRYFVIRLQDEAGRNAFIGLGFGDRSDSFDLNVSLQEHFKQLRQEAESERSLQDLAGGPKLDLGFKEGQTIRIQLNTKKSGGEGSASASRKTTSSSGGAQPLLLPPPPAAGSTVMRIAPPPPSASSTSNSNAFGAFGAFDAFGASGASSNSSSNTGKPFPGPAASASASSTSTSGNSVNLLDF